MNETPLTPTEKRAAFSLAGIYSLRMLGLFLVLPVFSIYASQYPDATPLGIGIALGAYGLTQAIFQIPFGLLSDHYGRKPVITLGLLIFALGSVIAAVSDSLTGVIIGRALQGSGAIAAAVMALTADLTREDHRAKAMATIGMSIGLSFAAAMVLGPQLAHWFGGLAGLFWITGVLAISGLVVLHFWVPMQVRCSFHRDAETSPTDLWSVLSDTRLLGLNFGIFILHMILTATFVAVPLALSDQAGQEVSGHTYVYLPVMLISLVAMVPLVILAEKYRRMKQVFIMAITLVIVSEFMLALVPASVVGIAVALLVFFVAFNTLEACLPSIVSKLAPPDKKGTSMGLYSTSQFLGAFVGGVGGGFIYSAFSLEAIFLFCAISGALWLVVAIAMREPRHSSSMMLNLGELNAADSKRIASEMSMLPGVYEAVIVPEDGIAYLKVDHQVLDAGALDRFLPGQGSGSE